MEFDLVIVGAGFAGMCMLARARAMGLSARVFEAGGGVGGTWYWNRYPGARCDVESLEYSFSFSDALQRDWVWSERYAAQPELLRYANHVADRFDLRRDIVFHTRVGAARFDESSAQWVVDVASADADGALTDAVAGTVRGRWLVMATGCLSSANLPEIAGRERFAGPTYHTGRWPHEGVDFTGRRVGIIGTGSSAIQAIPLIAAQAEHLTVFQRTPAYSVPANNGPIDPERLARVRADYPGFRARNRRMPAAFGSELPRDERPALSVDEQTRREAFEARWRLGGFGLLGAFGDLMLDERANETAAEFVREKIRGIVRDPDTARKLMPRQRIGCKRLCVDTDYYATFNRPNVTLVDLRDTPIEAIEPEGVRVRSGDGHGALHRIDCLVFATGFDALTGALDRIELRGRGGRTLREHWRDGPVNYLGLMVSGFPNLFTITGPGSPSVLTNMIVSIEHHVDWIAKCIAHVRDAGRTTIEATGDAERRWVGHVNAVADRTLYPGCNSWYLGANVPGKPRVFMPLIGFPAYVEACEKIVSDGYTGFSIG